MSGDKVPRSGVEEVLQPLEVIILGGVDGLGFASLIGGGREHVVHFFESAFRFPEFD